MRHLSLALSATALVVALLTAFQNCATARPLPDREPSPTVPDIVAQEREKLP